MDDGRAERSGKPPWCHSCRMLLVDDNEPFRRSLFLMLQEISGLCITGEAADGFEAVQKAESIKPDIVLLDIGLPKVNGLNVAELIRKCSPESKIVCLTNETDPDVVKAALDTGAVGYVHKLQAGTELKTAVEAALRGQQFVSPNLKVNFLDTFAA
jgi:DNA-binding NarL/FixJ family response regulator